MGGDSVLERPLPEAVLQAGRPWVEGTTDLALTPSDWEHLVGDASAHRATGLLYAAVVSGALIVSPQQESELFERHAERMRHALVIERELVRVAEVLADARVELRVLKGVAVSELDYPDPAWREFEDLDVLIAPHQLDSAVRALVGAGYNRDLPERRRGTDARFAKDVTLVGATGVEVDVHRTLAPGALGFLVDLEELRAEPDVLTIGGTALKALGIERRLLHAAYGLTVAEERPRAATARDLVQLLPRANGGLVVDLSERWRAGAILAEALGLVTHWFGSACVPDALARWSDDREPTRWERAIRRSYRSAGGTNASTLLAGAVGIDRWTDRGAYLRSLVLPSSEYRAARRRAGRSREWRTGTGELLRRRAR